MVKCSTVGVFRLCGLPTIFYFLDASRQNRVDGKVLTASFLLGTRSKVDNFLCQSVSGSPPGPDL